MKKYFTKLCARCQIVTIQKNRIYCGSDKRKIGCSYLVKLERSREWRKARPEYWKVEEAWRHRVGFYKREKVILDRRKRQREYYKNKKHD